MRTLLVVALLVVGLTELGRPAAIRPAAAASCVTASPLYTAIGGDESAKTDWYFAGIAGPIPNGYTGTMYVSVFNQSSASASVHADIFEYQELASASQTLDIFSEGIDLTGGRSQTLAFNGLPPHPSDPITVPTGKVHFHVQAAAPVSVYAEQWLSC